MSEPMDLQPLITPAVVKRLVGDDDVPGLLGEFFMGQTEGMIFWTCRRCPGGLVSIVARNFEGDQAGLTLGELVEAALNHEHDEHGGMLAVETDTDKPSLRDRVVAIELAAITATTSQWSAGRTTTPRKLAVERADRMMAVLAKWLADADRHTLVARGLSACGTAHGYRLRERREHLAEAALAVLIAEVGLC